MLIAIWEPVSHLISSSYWASSYVGQGKWYRSSTRQVRRLEAVIPGPINAIYGETVAGIAVIRAHGVQSVFVQGWFIIQAADD